MRRLGYLLILLVFSAQVDDTWGLTSVSTSVPLADEDNEYLASQETVTDQECSPRGKQVFARLKALTADLPPVGKDVRTAWNATAPFAPRSLYVYMSLLI
jgi:hypothetical protein